MAKRHKQARIEHIKYTIGGDPNGQVVRKAYRVVVFTTQMKGSKVIDTIDWVGEVKLTRRDVERLQRRVSKEHGVEITNLTLSVTIYSPMPGM